MKKQWFVGLAAILAMGCFAGCDTQTNGSSGKETSGITSSSGTATVNTQVTEEQWKAAWEYDTSQGICVEGTMEAVFLDASNPSRKTWITKQKNNVMHNTVTSNNGNGNIMSWEDYYVINDADFSITNYSKSYLRETWEKYTDAYSAQEYEADKLYWKNSYLFMGMYDELLGLSTSANGEELDIKQLYSAFSYNNVDKKYSATLYKETYSILINVTFAEGKIVQGKVESEVDGGASLTCTFTATYDVADIVIPQEILNAPED